MNKHFFNHRSEMTSYALASGLEMIRCKQTCNHVYVGRAAILLVDNNVIVERLVRCKVCNQLKKEAGNDNL